jgi:hypothetical protein
MTHHSTVALPGNPDMSQYNLMGLVTSGHRQAVACGPPGWKVLIYLTGNLVLQSGVSQL